MKVFDMHIHIGEGAIDQNYLLDKMAESGVYGGGIISPVPEENSGYRLPYGERLKSVLDWTKGQEGRLIPILFINPFEKDVLNKVKDAKESGVKAYKIICEDFTVDCPECMRLLGEIEKTGLPVMFHSGILWSGTDSSKNNRPVLWESLMKFDNLKFSLAHCSWPWIDECIAVYGKFLNSYLTRQSSEMFFDTTPGTPKIYRKELLTKLFTVGYDVENNLMFGTDSLTTEYVPDWVGGWLRFDNEIMDELGVKNEVREKMFEKNFMRFLSGEDVEHNLPHINK
ncbi:MAG: amidohydrolase family protein [Clostridia bacterium]|nr:amidohydrolase family protein [Clostridia bacterium]